MPRLENLAVIIKIVREAQGVSQAALAKAVGKTQSSITQYEKQTATLSLETLKKIAVILNMNPNYIETGEGNLFKAKSEKEVIKILMPESVMGDVDLGLMKYIMESSGFSLLLLMKPGESKDKQWQTESLALLLQDNDDNIFIFRRKNSTLTFSDRDIRKLVSLAAKKEDSSLELRSILINESLCDKIRIWGGIGVEDVQMLIAGTQHIQNRLLIGKLFETIQAKTPANQYHEKYDNLVAKIDQMKPDDLEKVVSKLIPECEKILKEEFTQ